MDSDRTPNYYDNNYMNDPAPILPNYYNKCTPPFVPYGPHHNFNCPHYNYSKPDTLKPIVRPKTHSDCYYKNPPIIFTDNKCHCGLQDRFPVSNILNVESRLKISLEITLYGLTEEDDVKVLLDTGKKYKILYLSEDGVVETEGYLRYIDSTISTECIRYIGNYDDVANYAHIIMDCSQNGFSDIRKIFIKSIRGLEEVVEPTDNEENPDTGDDNVSEGNSNTDSSTEDPGSDNNSDKDADGEDTDKDINEPTETDDKSSNTEDGKEITDTVEKIDAGSLISTANIINTSNEDKLPFNNVLSSIPSAVSTNNTVDTIGGFKLKSTLVAAIESENKNNTNTDNDNIGGFKLKSTTTTSSDNDDNIGGFKLKS